MKKILFVTGNERKVWQANDVLKAYGIQVEARDLDVPEIQSHDPLKVTIAKAKSAYELAGEPVVVCDFGWSIPALNGFPGAYMKDMNHWLMAEDFLKLMEGKEDRSVNMSETIVFTDGKTTEHFTVIFPAKFAHEPRGTSTNANEHIVIYDGSDKTIAEHIDAGEHARDMEKSAWQDFGKWYRNIEDGLLVGEK